MICLRNVVVPSALSAALIVSGAQASTPPVETARPAGISPLSNEAVGALVASTRFTAIRYDDSVGQKALMDRAAGDAEGLGFRLVKVFPDTGLVVLEAPRRELARALASSESLPVTGLRTVLHPNANPHPDLMTVYTDRLLVEFDPATTERAKTEWFEATGFEAVRELPSGRVILRTFEDPDVLREGGLNGLVEENAFLRTAIQEMTLTGRPALSTNSLEVTDPLFVEYQWYLWNSPTNTNFGFGTPDEDIDAPRGWMYNQTAGVSPFGSDTVTVAVFDSGIEIAHPDLAAAFGAVAGFDAIDAGLPNPPLANTANLLNVHGTAMAGLIAAQVNGLGIVGGAPGARIYASRVFSESYTTTNVQLIAAFEDSTFGDIDVNVHPYGLLTPDGFAALAEVEAALRASFESGRNGLGTTNVAAAGNRYSQVEYPASSPWTLAVGGVTSEGNRVPQSNFGGAGVDFSMPGYVGDTTGFPTLGTGMVTTDISGRRGISVGSADQEGNESGDYAGIGSVLGIEGITTAVAEAWDGTSVSTALAGAVVALMYSDARYDDELVPLNRDPLTFPDLTGAFGPENALRESYRARAPFFRDPNNPANSVLAALKNYSDLPGRFPAPQGLSRDAIIDENGIVNSDLLDQLVYIDQYDVYRGFGRPNVGRLLARPEGLTTPDSAYESTLIPFLNYEWGQIGPAGASLDPEQVGAFDLGWFPDPENSIVTTFGEGEDEVEAAISPFLGGVTTIYEEDGTPVVAVPDEEGNPTEIFVWTDSLALADGDQADQDSPNDILFNPGGRYLRGQTIGILSPDISLDDLPSTGTMGIDPVAGVPAGVPIVVEIEVAHELGVENSSNVTTTQEGVPNAKSLDVDPLVIEVTFFGEEEGDEVTYEAGRITGDSLLEPKTPLVNSTTVNIGDEANPIFAPFWGEGLDAYNPFPPASQVVLRTYRFMVPPGKPSQRNVRFNVQLRPGNSYLPTYSIEDDPENRSQQNNVFRDHLGFQMRAFRTYFIDPGYVAYLNETRQDIGDGFFPTWSVSKNDVIISQPGDFLVALEPFRSYIPDPADITGGTATRPVVNRFLNLGGSFTGLRAHPTEERLVATVDQDGGAIFTLTNDGLNVTEIVDPMMAAGARDPSWAQNGNQVVYTGPDYLRIVNIDPDGNNEVETVLGPDHPYLTDFRFPFFDESAGLIYFAARLKDPQPGEDASLNLYISTRNGRIFGYQVAENRVLPILDGWQNIDLYDFDVVYADGRPRVIFTANASVPPAYSIIPGPDGNPVVDIPAQPSTGSRLFILENLDTVTSVNDTPIFSQVLLQPQFAGFDASARYGRISPDGRDLAWVGFTDEINLTSSPNIGKVFRQPLAERPELPDPPEIIITPAPSITPTVTPTPVNDAQAILVGGLDFSSGTEGWEFNPGGYVDPQAISRYTSVSGTPREIEDDVIGFLVGSNRVVVDPDSLVATLRFVGIGSGSPSLGLEGMAPRETRVLDGLGNALPTILGTSGAPGGSSRVFLSGVPASVAPNQQVTITVRIDPNGQPVQGIEGYVTFDTSVLRFVSGTSPSFFDRALSRSALTLRSPGNNNTFGFWGSPDSQLQVSPDSLYLYRAHVRASAGTPAAEVPTVRMRLNSRTFESAFTVETNSRGDLSLAPNVDAPKAIDLLFKPPTELFQLPVEDRKYFLSFDLLNFLTEDAANGGIALEEIEIYRFDDDRANDLTVIEDTNIIYNADLNVQENRDQFLQGPTVTALSLPNFLLTSNGLGMSVVDRAETFGFWGTDPFVPITDTALTEDSPTAIYRGLFQIRVDGESDPMRIPDLRLRLNTSDFQRSSTAILVANRDAVVVPTSGDPRLVEVYLVLEEVPTSFAGLFASFDLLSFYPADAFPQRTVTNAGIFLELVRLERVDIPLYPPTR